MNYKYWCQFLSPDEFENWEVEVLMFLSSGRGRNDFFEIDFDNWKEFIYDENWVEKRSKAILNGIFTSE
jgi:hypothetical protein